MNTILFAFLAISTVASANAKSMIAQDSIKVVKGQVSNYYIPVNNDYDVKGRVTDSQGKPLAGATVMWFASPAHCNTSADGTYTLRGNDGDKHLYVYYPGMRFANVMRESTQRTVDVVMEEGDNSQGFDGTAWYNGANVLPRKAAIATEWYNPQKNSTTTYCNPLNISYNYEPYNNNVKAGGCFRSSADPMALTYKGEYLLFSTNQGGYHYSSNLSDWDFRTATFQRHPTDDDVCAPAAFVSGDTLFYAGSTYEGAPIWYSTNPASGRWKQAVTRSTLPSWDPGFFLDDDGKLYLYYGSSNEYPIKAVELSRETFAPISKIHDVVLLHPEVHGWERFGMNNDDEVTLKPFMEGAYLTKHDGKYYLQYGAPGTEFKVYADGVYVGDSPLGPFTYQKHNPMSYKPGGFVQGVGHGGTFCDLHGQYWHVGTCMLSLKYKFERRIGLYPVAFDKDGIMHSNTAFGDYPQKNADYIGNDRFTGWMLLSYKKNVTVSSTDSTLAAGNLSDENIRTYWSAKTGNAGEWLQMDLGAEKTVHAMQLNFYDRKTVQTMRANDTFYQYRIFASNDGKQWQLVVDKSDNDRDVPHDYVELQRPLRARYLRVENLHMPGGGNFCLSDFRVFGNADGDKPAVPSHLNVVRDKKDSRNGLISWNAVPGVYGYQVYYGIAPDKLYNCITVYDDTSYDFRGMDKGTEYWFAVQSLSETGASPLSKTIKR